MKKKIFISMCLVSFVSVLVTSVLSVFVIMDDSRNAMISETKSESNYMSTAYESLGVDYLKNLGGGTKARITLVSEKGSVIFDSYADETKMENHSDRPEIAEAISQGTGEATRLSGTMNEETYYYALRLSDGNILRVANTISSVYAAMFATLPWIIGIFLLSLVVSAIIARILTSSIVKPINQLDLDAPGENVIYDELTPLLSRMDKQRKQIGDQIDILNTRQIEFKAITENMREGLLIINDKAEVLSYNSSALSLFGHSADFPDHASVYMLSRNVEFSEMIECGISGKPMGQTLKLNGRYCEILVNPVISGDKVSGAVIVVLDVTEREKREDMRREFTANVSHELKTPLTSISGYAEIIKNGLVKPEDVGRFAGNIYNEAQRLIALVGDIIKLSRLDEGGGDMQKTDVELKSLSESVKSRLAPMSDAKRIKVSVVGSELYVYGVRNMLEEMLYNLCDNAIKYNNLGGNVTVSTQIINGNKTLSVADDGIGIPEKDIDRIFERFYRVDKSHSKETGGTGLGLSIVKHCVMLHGGEIQVSSKLGVGTTITISFP